MPFAVIAATAAVIAYAAWPTIRPVTEVNVTQAVFDRAAAQPTPPTINTPEATPNATPDQTNTATQTVQAPGWLEAEPFITAATALTDGIVATIAVLAGDRVTKGQTLATLVPDDAALALARAEAQLAAAEALGVDI